MKKTVFSNVILINVDVVDILNGDVNVVDVVDVIYVIYVINVDLEENFGDKSNITPLLQCVVYVKEVMRCRTVGEILCLKYDKGMN